jgi:hypothetical protein
MGGLGSGTWQRSGTKATVEDSLTLPMSDFRGRIYPKSAGAFAWTWSSGKQSSVGYFLTWDDEPTITLHYRWGDSQDVRILVRLQTTPTQFSGERWWFTCPLIVGGVACNRRVGKLYLPPGAHYFGCRKCHDLTYESCQEAHREERRSAKFGRKEE